MFTHVFVYNLVAKWQLKLTCLVILVKGSLKKKEKQKFKKLFIYFWVIENIWSVLYRWKFKLNRRKTKILKTVPVLIITENKLVQFAKRSIGTN